MSKQFSSIWKRYANRVITTAQVTADFLAVFLAFWIGYWFYEYYGGYSPLSPQEYVYVSAGAALLHITVFKAFSLYKREISLLNIEELKQILIASVWGSFLFLGSAFYFRSITLSRLTTTIALVASVLLVILERMIIYRIHMHFHLRGYSQKKVLIYGAGEVGRHLLKRIYQSPALGLAPVGFIDDSPDKADFAITFREFPRARGNRVLGTFKDLPTLVAQHTIEEVLIAMPSANYDAIKNVVRACQAAGTNYAIVPHAFDLLIEKIKVHEIGGIPILRTRQTRPSRLFLFFKRLIDLLGAAALITAFSPLYIVFSVLIKMDSKGPVIFKQKRVGLRGKEFSFYKFRTMHVDAAQYAQTPQSAQDPRITRVGRWLRRTSLDELPQLFNVLRGDMSLVGPRPEMPFIVRQYTPLQRERLSVKPGITGVWQISAVRGDPIHANIEYDLYYIENQSVLLDMVILIKTVFGVIRCIGAV